MGAGWDVFFTNVRAASGNLTAAETSTSVNLPGHLRVAIFTVRVTTVTIGGGETVDFYVQTTYDNGTTWRDLANFQLDNTHNGTAQTRFIVINPAASATNLNVSDAAIATNTAIATLPLGDRVRIKTTISGTPTYAYSSDVFMRR